MIFLHYVKGSVPPSLFHALSLIFPPSLSLSPSLFSHTSCPFLSFDLFSPLFLNILPYFSLFLLQSLSPCLSLLPLSFLPISPFLSPRSSVIAFPLLFSHPPSYCLSSLSPHLSNSLTSLTYLSFCSPFPSLCLPSSSSSSFLPPPFSLPSIFSHHIHLFFSFPPLCLSSLLLLPIFLPPLPLPSVFSHSLPLSFLSFPSFASLPFSFSPSFLPLFSPLTLQSSSPPSLPLQSSPLSGLPPLSPHISSLLFNYRLSFLSFSPLCLSFTFLPASPPSFTPPPTYANFKFTLNKAAMESQRPCYRVFRE